VKSRTKIKTCGMTNVSDVGAAVALGVDAIGVILHADSPRTIALEHASAIRQVVPEGIKLVGVFVDASSEFIEAAIEVAGLDLVQLHGDESNDFGARLTVPFIKAVRVESQQQLNTQLASYPSACAILLDPYVKGQHGGTGRQLDLRMWPTQHHQKLILAGGLSPENIVDSVCATQPFAIDINSGVEISPGVKNHAKIGAVIELLALS